MRLSELVPGGCHCYSKGDDCFPINAPEYLVKGEGCHVQDAKGKRFEAKSKKNTSLQIIPFVDRDCSSKDFFKFSKHHP